VFELGEELLDRVQIGTVRWQEKQMGADLANGTPCCFAFMATEIVEDYDIAFDERRSEDLLDVEGEELAVDGSVDNPGCINAIDAQGSDEGECLPMSVRNMRHQALSPRSPAAQGRHVGLDPGLVEEDQPVWLYALLISLPSSALASNVWPILLSRQNAFF